MKCLYRQNNTMVSRRFASPGTGYVHTNTHIHTIPGHPSKSRWIKTAYTSCQWCLTRICQQTAPAFRSSPTMNCTGSDRRAPVWDGTGMAPGTTPCSHSRICLWILASGSGTCVCVCVWTTARQNVLHSQLMLVVFIYLCESVCMKGSTQPIYCRTECPRVMSNLCLCVCERL